MLYVVGFIDLIFVTLTIAYFLMYMQMKDTRPTPMICPYCKSPNVRFVYHAMGANTYGHQASFNGVFANQHTFGSAHTDIEHRNMVQCQQCGYTFRITTANEINAASAKKQTSAVMYGLISVALTAFIVYWMYIR